MKNKPQENDPINYMIARRRPKVNHSHKLFQHWKPYVLTAGVSLACVGVIIGSSIAVCHTAVKKAQNVSKQMPKKISALPQSTLNELTRSVDVELMGLVEKYQNFDGISPKYAVDKALYDMWYRYDVDCKNNPSEEAQACLMHITKRTKQANCMSLSNEVGDENPFLEMVYNETYKQDKIITSEMSVPDHTHSR